MVARGMGVLGRRLISVVNTKWQCAASHWIWQLSRRSWNCSPGFKGRNFRLSSYFTLLRRHFPHLLP
jgi:hypothetical protein